MWDPQDESRSNKVKREREMGEKETGQVGLVAVKTVDQKDACGSHTLQN